MVVVCVCVGGCVCVAFPPPHGRDGGRSREPDRYCPRVSAYCYSFSVTVAVIGGGRGCSCDFKVVGCGPRVREERLNRITANGAYMRHLF